MSDGAMGPVWRLADARPPSLDRLHPRGSAAPALPDLVDVLAATPAGPDLDRRCIPYALATLSGYAYGDETTLATAAARLGLPGCRCRMVSEYVDAMFIDSTAFIVQSADGRVAVLVYRGTRPEGLIDWLLDLEVDPDHVHVPLDGRERAEAVHRGFYRNVRATGYEVVHALERAVWGRPVTGSSELDGPALKPLEALYITGHSLGGAMAALAGVLLGTDPAYADIAGRLRAVHTFGQPMVGTPELAQLADSEDVLRDRVYRWVYRDDVVPQLPPRAAGPFAHFGAELRWSDGRWAPSPSRRQMRSLLALLELAPSFLARQLAAGRRLRFRASADDHLPTHYIDALTPPGVRTEFGS